MPRPKGHTTLSDLLADDVRDYFLREGVPADRPASESAVSKPHHRRKKRHGKRQGGRGSGDNGDSSHHSNGNGKHKHQHHDQQQRPQQAIAASSPVVTRSSTGSLRAGWAGGTPSASRNNSNATGSSVSSSSPSYHSGSYFSNASESTTVHDNLDTDTNNDAARQEQIIIQKKQQNATRPEKEQQQLRGQNTSERHTNGYYQRNNSNGLNRTFNSQGSNGSIGNNNNLRHHLRSSSGSFSFLQNNSSTSTTHQRNNSIGSYTHQRSNSTGSASTLGSKKKYLTPADTEFLRQYKQEKERTNLRMTTAFGTPNVHIGGGVEAHMPKDDLSSFDFNNTHGTSSASQQQNDVMNNSNNRPYHALLSSSRPPTVTGSHRPGLPSIDNDDWEEDDRIERRDIRKKERKEARKLEKKIANRKRSSTVESGGTSGAQSFVRVGTAGSAGGSLYQDQQHQHQHQQQMMQMQQIQMQNANGIYSNSNNNMMMQGNNNTMMQKMEQRPKLMEERMISHGSATDTSHSTTTTPVGVGLTPGSSGQYSDSMCYSTGSSYQNPTGGGLFAPAIPIPEMPDYSSHSREDSGGTFVRRDSGQGSTSVVPIVDTNQQQQQQQQHAQYPRQETNAGEVKQNTKQKQRHVRPLSYLSASSDSGKEDAMSSGNELAVKEEEDALSPSNKTQSTKSSGSGLRGLGAIPTPTNTSVSGSTANYSLPSTHGSLSSGTIYNTKLRLSSATDNSSALLGAALIDNNNGNVDASEFTRVNRPGGYGEMGGYQYQHHPQQYQRYDEDESSDESYNSDEFSDSSYTSSSYYGDSSSASQTSSERRRPLPSRSRSYQNNDDVSWAKVNFGSPRNDGHLDSRDVEKGGGGEQQKLFGRNGGGGPTYSSMESHKSPKNRRADNKTKNRVYKSVSRNGHHRHGNNRSSSGVPLRLDQAIEVLLKKMNSVLVLLELFISNMPTLVASLSLAWVSIGVDWFKWYEETFNACHPAHYHNKSCVFTEFPGCFACDTEQKGYQFFLHLHYLCSTIAFCLTSSLIGKILIAFPVVRDELANPTTAAPIGLVCMALEKVFAGNFGLVGESVTFAACAFHLLVGCWFIFISVVYKTLPEPSWFSNTTGIGLAAAKMYLYFTPGGYFLAGFSVLAFAMFFCVSLYRIHTNEKISAPVCWVQLSGPAVVLYGFTIFSQPASDEDDYALLIEENRRHFFYIHRKFYMPVLNIFFAFCLVSMVSSLYLVRSKWKSFREKEFSPAHVSFCAPLVSHVNAMQAYRSSLQKFSQTPPGTPLKLLLYRYWTFGLVTATVLVLWMTFKFFAYLPGWCQINVEDDELPPAPEDAIVTRLLETGDARDEMTQNFVSAAVLQANESGALVRVRQDGRMKYVRSRRMPSMGFDPIMNVSELMSERDRLLQHVTYAANPSRDRGGITSFDDTLRNTFHEPEQTTGPHRSAGPGRRSWKKKMDFMSFDASTMMRGDF